MKKEIKRIFIASPSDTTQERKRVNQVVYEINNTLEDITNIKFEVIKWETHAVPAMGRPQEIINQQLKLDEVDLFIGTIRGKFGSSTGGKMENGKPYESGTYEEFERVYQSWKANKKPEIIFFRCIKSESLKNVDPIQLEKVNKFFREFSHDKSHPGLYKEYKSISEFEQALRMSLIRYMVSSTSKEISNQDKFDFNERITDLGFQKFYLPNNNAERNLSKRNSISASKSTLLIAHSGYSFLAQFGHRYRDIIEEKLANGNTFKAILTNPWSESGFFIALGELSPSQIFKFCYKKKDGKNYIDCIKVIKHSKWYQMKYNDSLNGYNMLRKKYEDRIQIRFTRFDIPSSVLLTDDDCYIEPYIPVNIQERYEKGMLTFEVKLSSTAQLYQHNVKYFEFLWEVSDSFEEYNKNVRNYKRQLKSKITMRSEE